MKKKTKKQKCKTCYGYGLWNDDSNQPMGPIDASDGFTTKACPECGKNANGKEIQEVKSSLNKFVKELEKLDIFKKKH